MYQKSNKYFFTYIGLNDNLYVDQIHDNIVSLIQFHKCVS
jgi:hypothetical protein